MDDYRPDKQRHVAAAVDAAAQFGGLVIITSNYPDPFKLFDVGNDVPASAEDILLHDAAARTDPEAYGRMKESREQKQSELSASLRSRIAGGFKMIHFDGPDRRPQNNFWDQF